MAMSLADIGQALSSDGVVHLFACLLGLSRVEPALSYGFSPDLPPTARHLYSPSVNQFS